MRTYPGAAAAIFWCDGGGSGDNVVTVGMRHWMH